jgi:hypothetical protein
VTDFITFVRDVAALVLAELPLQSFDSSISLAYAYISNVGGWVPVDDLQPLGDGEPANGFTEQQCADAITQNEFNSVYDIDFQVTISIKLQAINKLTDGLTLDDAASAMLNQVSNFIIDTVNNSTLPVLVLSTDTQTTNAANSLLGGYTTQTVRENIQTAIEASPTTKDVDHKGIALMYVRNIYGVDDTWNVWAVYVQPDNPIVVMIKKYTDNTYATLDNSTTAIYVINISPVTYQVVAGIIID